MAFTSIHPMQITAVAKIKSLIVAGLAERWGEYDAHFNEDVEDFANFYKNSVVLVAKQLGETVGVGILQPVDIDSAQIVRMYVSKNLRRNGIGALVLTNLIATARQHGLKQIVLETTATWQSAVSFYKKHGFVPLHIQGDDQYFNLDLSGV